MMPKGMKKTWWLIPACFICFTAGIFFLLVLLVPEFAPRLHANMMRRGVFVLAPLIGGFNIVAPITVRWYYSRQDQEPEE